MSKHPLTPENPTACLVLSDGTVFYGTGFGAEGIITAELCFNTAMTGYQEIMTDPSYDGQAITFTFPHIGNTGTNRADCESARPFAKAMVIKHPPSVASNWRSEDDLAVWATKHGVIGIAGVDTRRLTRAIRTQGAPHVAIAHSPDGQFDLDSLRAQARDFAGLEDMDLAGEVSCTKDYHWQQGRWQFPAGFEGAGDSHKRVVAIDFGAKRNILRCLHSAGCEVVVLPATTSADDILAQKPDGIFLSNGPGDPAATGIYAVPMIKRLLQTDLPIFGICLGHQMLGLALGAKTIKMGHGHHGANHPVKEIATGKVEITSMNHGFAVDSASLPKGVIETHVSLFDGSNCGLMVADRPPHALVFSVQQHPEASPGPTDSFYLFQRFADSIKQRQDA